MLFPPDFFESPARACPLPLFQLVRGARRAFPGRRRARGTGARGETRLICSRPVSPGGRSVPVPRARLHFCRGGFRADREDAGAGRADALFIGGPGGANS